MLPCAAVKVLALDFDGVICDSASEAFRVTAETFAGVFPEYALPAGAGDDARLYAQFLEAMGGVQDFWQEPSYATLLQAMQKRLHEYVVANKGSAKEALDGLIVDWTETFKEEGKI